MKALQHDGDFLQVKMEPDPANFGNNSDSFTFTITTCGGQMLEVKGREEVELAFTIVGPLELDEFFAGILHIYAGMHAGATAGRSPE